MNRRTFPKVDIAERSAESALWAPQGRRLATGYAQSPTDP